jgi:hypothetical protein
MIAQNIAPTMLASYEKVIDLLGVVASLQHVKPPSTTVANIKVGFAGISKEDQVLVNSYGINGKVITFKAVDVVATPPTKFDSVTMASGETYTIDTVMPVHLPGGAIVGFKAYIRGHQ